MLINLLIPLILTILGKNAFFIDGPGGTGKTFLYNVLLSEIRSKNQVALAVASSGIAALLLPGGRTAHSRFKIPFVLELGCTCRIELQSETAELIRVSRVILWDECPMCNKLAFEALDITFRDIMGKADPSLKDIPFGNKIIIFGGDFRQILPVVISGTQEDIVSASFNRSHLWSSVIKMKLTINMRVKRLAQSDPVAAQDAREFSDWLIRIGEGTEQTYT